MTTKHSYKPFLADFIPESGLLQPLEKQADGLLKNLAATKKSVMKKLQPKPGTFSYLQKTQNGVLLKQEEILKAFSCLTTALLIVYLVVFKTLCFIQPGFISNFIIASPLSLSIVQLVFTYKKKFAQALFITICLLPAVMVGVSMYNKEINYSKVILIYTLVLILLGNTKQLRLAGFVYLTLAYILIQLRYYQHIESVNSQLFAFDVLMMPVFSLIIFVVLTRIRKEFTVYQKEIRLQNEVLEKKNTSLETLVSFSEQQKSKLKRTVLLKEKLISIISHDVRLPLSAFKMLINNYEKGYMTDKMVIDGILETKKELTKIDFMVMDLVNWSRNEVANAGQQQITSSNLSEIIESVLTIYALCAKPKRLNIVPCIDIPENMCLAIPKRELEIVLRNLLSNAIKFSNPDSNINVSLKAEKATSGMIATLSVRDFGKGMYPSTLKQINGSRMVSSIGTLDEVGLGVGLSIVFDVINNHSLQYNITSELNNGTEFSINIPLVSC
ncbi:MAG: HAMP domain-containing sensor histidine kinase [Bacteroidota bacterium]